MTTTPFEPHRDPGDEDIPAADPGRGAPEPAPGFGPEGVEPDPREPVERREPADNPDPAEPPD
ncbi:hypothetical protein [Actinophytocola gossypii]|uniref:Uncharacterized protein n=1 Tax=Actinophytocola gossypii TaxID=2812003 RepID=A0ABT2J116_9PSEU|nr:hypothetical protein [Actinophytocola gossypii]MCT2581552.1 hypothetical protein [Actinophytocola gossypii]